MGDMDSSLRETMLIIYYVLSYGRFIFLQLVYCSLCILYDILPSEEGGSGAAVSHRSDEGNSSHLNPLSLEVLSDFDVSQKPWLVLTCLCWVFSTHPSSIHLVHIKALITLTFVLG